MNCRAHASSVADAGWQGTRAGFFTASAASASAASRYFSASRGLMARTVALLAKPPVTWSAGNASAGERSTPRRSRTVLLYSTRVSRRSGEGDGAAVTQGGALLAPPGPGAGPGPGAEVPDAPLTAPWPAAPVSILGWLPEHAAPTKPKLRDSVHAARLLRMATSDSLRRTGG